MSWRRWLCSRTVREACAMRAGADRLLREQRDVISAESATEFDRAIQDLRWALREAAPDARLQELMASLHESANAHLHGHTHPALRENLVEIQGVCVKVFALFCFFLQPMAIPSGSAQPTLYGIIHTDGRGRDAFTRPGFVRRCFEATVLGVRYYRIVAPRAGTIEEIEPAARALGLFKRQRIRLAGEWQSVWFPPDGFVERAGIAPGDRFEAGEEVVNLRVKSGDHLLVDRLSYNFRTPHRGETIVFASTGVPGLIQNTHYIKRLVAVGGEHVRIGDDRHLIIDGARLDASTPGFENVYSFTGPPRESQYSGHVNGTVGRTMGRGNIAPLFPDAQTEFVVPPNHYLAMGDNTMNSHDSRAWGAFPREKVIGKAAFVFWPISPRFGWGFH